MKSAVPFCFENILKLREKGRENLVCRLMWGYSGNKKKVQYRNDCDYYTDLNGLINGGLVSKKQMQVGILGQTYS